MIIDVILDRRADDLEGHTKRYDPSKFYRDVREYEGYEICALMDYGTENDVKTELCEYVIRNEYNPAVCGYIWSVNWLTNEPVLTGMGTRVPMFELYPGEFNKEVA